MTAENLQEWTVPFAPAPPDWTVDWNGLLNRFAWLGPLAECPQDPRFHAEGDVLTHTRMVVEALVALPEWRASDASSRGVLFLAALFHDAGKGERTQVHDDGRIGSAGHARLSASLARRFLWDTGAPVDVREQTANLIERHGLPPNLLNESDPVRAIITSSMTARGDFLALLAEADMRGRIASDLSGMLDRVHLFRDFAAENACLRAPYAFASDHARVMYFLKPQMRPDDVIYDDTLFGVVLLSGLPAAGKDEWVRANGAGRSVVSLDTIRKEISVGPEEDQSPVIAAAKEQARVLMRRREPFIWNATNATRLIRRQLIEFFRDYGARVSVIYLEAPWEEMLRRNARRTKPVPVAVMERLRERLEVPDLTEAHSVSRIMTG